ncbi:MAG: phage major capsid protein [Planctomycetota bacterium]
MTLKEVREKLAANRDRARQLKEQYQDKPWDDEGKRQLDELLAETEPLRQQEERLTRFAQLDELMVEPAAPQLRQRLAEPEERDLREIRDLDLQIRRATAGPAQRFLPAFASARDAYESGMWFMGVMCGRRRALDWCRDHMDLRAMSGSDNTLGGALVPIQFETAIINLKEQYGTFRMKARRWPMASETDVIPRRTTGVTAYFVGEGQEVTASDVKTDAVELNARKLAALCKYSSELDEDSAVSIGALVANEIAYSMAVKEDQCGFLGDGTSTYGGIVGLKTRCDAATATIVTAATGNTAFGTLDLADLEGMIGLLPEFPGMQPEWYVSKAGWAASMQRLADAAGGATMTELQSGRRVREFLGYPVNFVQCMNKTLTAQTSTSGLVYFGDLLFAASFGDRRGLRLKVSTERYLELDQLAVIGTERIAINVHDVGDTSSAGAIVMLATPGS